MYNINFLNENVNKFNKDYYFEDPRINSIQESFIEEFNEAEEMAFTENAFTDFIKKAFQAIIKLFERAKDFILRLVRSSDKKYSLCMQKLRYMDKKEQFTIPLKNCPIITKIPVDNLLGYIKKSTSDLLSKDNITDDDKKKIFDGYLDIYFKMDGFNTGDKNKISSYEEFKKYVEENVINEDKNSTESHDVEYFYNYLKNNPNYGDRYFANPLKKAENIFYDLEKKAIDNNDNAKDAINILKDMCNMFMSFIMNIQRTQTANLNSISNALNINDKTTYNHVAKSGNLLKEIEAIVDKNIDKYINSVDNL